MMCAHEIAAKIYYHEKHLNEKESVADTGNGGGEFRNTVMRDEEMNQVYKSKIVSNSLPAQPSSAKNDSEKVSFA